MFGGVLPRLLLLRAFWIVADLVVDASVFFQRDDISNAIFPALYFDGFENVLVPDVHHPFSIEDDFRSEGFGV